MRPRARRLRRVASAPTDPAHGATVTGLPGDLVEPVAGGGLGRSRCKSHVLGASCAGQVPSITARGSPLRSSPQSPSSPRPSGI